MVHSEQPRSAATSAMFMGVPSGGGPDGSAEFVSPGCGQCCGFLCPMPGAPNSNVSAAFPLSSKPYFSPSASCLALMASLLTPERPSDQLPKPFRKQAPQPPQQADKNSKDNESVLELRRLYECHKAREGHVAENDSEGDL